MRAVSALALAGLSISIGSISGCGSQKAADLTPITQADETLKRDETDLLAQRGALQRERKRLTDERAELVQKRKTVAPADRSAAAALDDQEVALTKKENDLLSQESDLSKKLDTLLLQRAELIQKATAQVAVAPSASADERAARREGQVADREKSVAQRERDLAAREQTLATRERDLAKREKETCGVAQVAPAPKIELPKALKYGQHDVEPLYKKGLKMMQDRGLLAADLPTGGKLVDDTRNAMQAGDYVRAKYAADQLLEEVQAVHIDRAFLAAKMARLSTAMKGKSLDGDTKRQADALFQEATSAYGDGKFPAANQKVNRLFALIQR